MFSCDAMTLNPRFEKLDIFTVDASPSLVYDDSGLQSLLQGCTRFFQLSPAETTTTALLAASFSNDLAIS